MEFQATRTKDLVQNAVDLLANSAFTIKRLQALSGRPSTQTIYRRIKLYQAELGYTENLPAEEVLTDLIFCETWKTLNKFLDDEQKRSSGDPIQILRAVTRKVIYFFADRPNLFAVIARGIPTWAKTQSRKFHPEQERFWQNIRDLFRLAQKKRFLVSTIDPDLLVRIIIGAVHHALYGFTLRPKIDEQYTPEDVVRSVEQLLERLKDNRPKGYIPISRQNLISVPTLDIGLS